METCNPLLGNMEKGDEKVCGGDVGWTRSDVVMGEIQSVGRRIGEREFSESLVARDRTPTGRVEVLWRG